MTRARAGGSLEALVESAKLLHASLELDDLLRSLLRSVMGRLVVSRGLLALCDADSGQARVAVSRGFKEQPVGSDFEPVASGAVAYLLTIGDPQSPTGYLALGRPLTGDLEAEGREFLEALLGIAASAIDNARAHAETRCLNRQLDRRVQQLNTLLDLVRSLTSALEPEQVARALGLTLAGQWLLRRYAVVAWKDGQPTVVRRQGMRLPPPEELLSQLRPVVDELGGAGLVAELPASPLREVLEASDAVAVVPLRSVESAIGFIALGAPARGEFTAEDFEFCTGLAAQAVVAFENAWHFADTLEREKLERDLSLAGEIQQRLFPVELPQLPGCQLAAHNRPAQHVGGDYYDALPVDGGEGGRYLLCVADVSGKGMAAALLMSNMQATLRALLTPDVDLAALVAHTNRLLHASSPANKFVTAIFLLIDPATGACRYVNAGHNEGFRLHPNGDLEPLPPGGLPVGLFAGGAYKEAELQLDPGDLVALYSDGVNEANDADGEEYSTERLIETLQGLATAGAKEVLDQVLGDVDAFAAGAAQYDDITLMVLKRTA